MSENNGNNNTNEGNDNGLPSHLKKIHKSLNRRQKEIYSRFNTPDMKIGYLEGIDEERRKSEIGTELIGLVLYTLITVIIVIIYNLCIILQGRKSYNVLCRIAEHHLLLIPIIVWTSLAALLGIFVISPAVTITFANI
ncbi:33419_t:CDS:2, partial [Gigaspora margarita]